MPHTRPERFWRVSVADGRPAVRAALERSDASLGELAALAVRFVRTSRLLLS